MTTPLTTRAPSIARPEIGAPSPWLFPTPEVEVLDNGLTVWAYDMPSQHVVALNLVMPTPLDAEPRDREGVAQLALQLADEGTRTHPGLELNDLLEGVGAAIGGGLHQGHSVSTMDVPASRLHQALPLFAEVITEPAYAEEDVDRRIALRLAELEQLRHRGPALAAKAARELRWGDSRRGRELGGGEETVSQISAADVHAFHDAFWAPEGSVMIVAGNLAGIDVNALVSDTFASWNSKRTAHADIEAHPAAPKGARILHLVDRPEAVQADLRIFGSAVDRSNPDWPALQAATIAMGGTFMSRLNKVLREERGYTYGADLGTRPDKVGGQWTFGTSVRTEVAASAASETLRILESNNEPFTSEEIADAVNQLVHVAPLRYDTAEAVADQSAVFAQYDLPLDYINNHYAKLIELRPSEVQDAYQRHISPAMGDFVAVGNAEELAPAFEAEGFEVIYLPA